jgi:hypothetical protein
LKGCPIEGVLFALPTETERELLAASSDADVIDIIDTLESEWDEENLCVTAEAWNAMHRALSDGSLVVNGGTYPLNHAILGGRHLYQGDDNFVVFVERAQVRDVAKALGIIDEAEFRERYLRLVPPDYAPEYGEHDLTYTWTHLTEVDAFYDRAARRERAVVFTVDQ